MVVNLRRGEDFVVEFAAARMVERRGTVSHILGHGRLQEAVELFPGVLSASPAASLSKGSGSDFVPDPYIAKASFICHDFVKSTLGRFIRAAQSETIRFDHDSY